jgi:hypothetical protein
MCRLARGREPLPFTFYSNPFQCCRKIVGKLSRSRGSWWGRCNGTSRGVSGANGSGHARSGIGSNGTAPPMSVRVMRAVLSHGMAGACRSGITRITPNSRCSARVIPGRPARSRRESVAHVVAPKSPRSTCIRRVHEQGVTSRRRSSRFVRHVSANFGGMSTRSAGAALSGFGSAGAGFSHIRPARRDKLPSSPPPCLPPAKRSAMTACASVLHLFGLLRHFTAPSQRIGIALYVFYQSALIPP